jgi:hypothetical protein
MAVLLQIGICYPHELASGIGHIAGTRFGRARGHEPAVSAPLSSGAHARPCEMPLLPAE